MQTDAPLLLKNSTVRSIGSPQVSDGFANMKAQCNETRKDRQMWSDVCLADKMQTTNRNEHDRSDSL